MRLLFLFIWRRAPSFYNIFFFVSSDTPFIVFLSFLSAYIVWFIRLLNPRRKECNELEGIRFDTIFFNFGEISC